MAVVITSVLAICTGISGCGLAHLHELNFVIDDRLHFLTPKQRSQVHQPVTVSWTMRDFTVAGPSVAPPTRDAGYFAIFVDRAPVRPGQTLRAVAHGDRSCESDPRCPDRAYLADHLVFTTTKTRIRLPLIPDLLNDHEGVQLHRITVVILDTTGHRIGESAWELTIRIPRAGA